MLELLSTIALLCQVNVGVGITYQSVESKQKDCQVKFLACVDNKKDGTYGQRLKACVVEKVNREPSSVHPGKKVFKKCISCHGNKAQGKAGSLAPALAGQHSWYIKKQIELIRDGKRTSGRSKVMKSIFKRLSKQDIKDVSNYLRSLGKCK